METYMRKEFTCYWWLIHIGVAVGILPMWMGLFPMIVTIASHQQPHFIFFALFAFGAVVIAGAAVAIPRLHKYWEPTPDITIDDEGLLLRAVKLEGDWWAQRGELMPWSEIHSVESAPYGRGEGIYVLWRGQRFRSWVQDPYLDSDGKFRSENSICEEIKATWDRCHNRGSVIES
jgi:hypothetical protein